MRGLEGSVKLGRLRATRKKLGTGVHAKAKRVRLIVGNAVNENSTNHWALPRSLPGAASANAYRCSFDACREWL